MDSTNRQNTLLTVAELKEQNQDFEWYPTTEEQIKTIVSDVKRLAAFYDINDRDVKPQILDIGAGDGRVLLALCDALNSDKGERDSKFKPFAIEKAEVHTATYSSKDITLLGTEFYETNLISKNASFAFVNPPYSDFSNWVSRIIQTLNFNVLYAVIPQRWTEDEQIKSAMKVRGIKYQQVIGQSDFLDAERQARARVDLVRFSFIDVSDEAMAEEQARIEARFKEDRHNWRWWRPSLNKDVTCPFQQFIENDLGLKKTHSETTEKFREYEQRERIRAQMNDTGSDCYALVKSEGILHALLDSYERDLQKVLEQYKLISQLDGAILAELGIEHKQIVEGIKEKLFGYRNVYWSLLFDQLDTLKEKLITTHKKDLLNTLSANALDFTYTNAVYIITFAVDMANGLIEESLVDVFKTLTNKDSIKTYYKSNEHMFQDDWRYCTRWDNDKDAHKTCKRELDYRFVFSGYGNFGNASYEKGLREDARCFTSDLVVIFRLLGYSNLMLSNAYDYICPGDKVTIFGTDPSGERIELVTIRFYLNGNRHMKWDQEAMLRFNVTVSRVLGWVRNKEDFAYETNQKKFVEDNVWNISDNLQVAPSQILRLKAA